MAVLQCEKCRMVEGRRCFSPGWWTDGRTASRYGVGGVGTAGRNGGGLAEWKHGYTEVEIYVVGLKSARVQEIRDGERMEVLQREMEEGWQDGSVVMQRGRRLDVCQCCIRGDR